jgi:hypothetical protein
MAVQVAARALTVWMAILVLAVFNGIVRESVLVPALGSAPGLFLSGLLLSCFILVVAFLALPWLGARSTRQLLLVGIGWVSLTLVFEFSFGWLQGMNLDELLSAYTFEGGNIWPLVLLVTAVAPWLAARLRGMKRSR